MSNTDTLREHPRSYRRMAKDWLSKYRWAAWLLTAAVLIQLTLTTVMAIHTYVYPFDIYSPGQFDHLAWWMYAADIAIHVYLLYRVGIFLSGKAESETLIGEFSNHPMWIYLFITSAMMVIL